MHDTSAVSKIHRAFRHITSRGKFVPRVMVHGPREVVSAGPLVLKLGSFEGKGVS